MNALNLNQIYHIRPGGNLMRIFFNYTILTSIGALADGQKRIRLLHKEDGFHQNKTKNQLFLLCV